MASITIRQLDDDLKHRLRLRAARNGRSMEEEARIILGDAAALKAKAGASRHQAAAADRNDAADDARPRRALATGARRVVLIIGGGIAAYKSLDLIRRLKEQGLAVRCILTRAAREFITPLSTSALSAERAFTDLFDPTTEFDVGHIRLAREADLIVVAPATADLLARMAGGHADDLACAVLLATDRPILVAPAMNPRMWEHPATQRNLAQLAGDGVAVVGPNAGEMAEAGEAGIGRMAEPLEIAAAALSLLGKDEGDKPLAGKRIIVTSGPTHEPIDPVRYIANRSSGKQGYAIARAAAALGANVTLVSGPVALPDPPGVKTVRVESARDMLGAVEAVLPVDVGVFAAAVADWRTADAGTQKLKKDDSGPPRLELVENPDILTRIARLKAKRPALVIGFAAETEKVIEHAQAKLKRKGCDWIVANDVSAEGGAMGGDTNAVHLITAASVDSWPRQSKDDVARNLVARIAAALNGTTP
jgi:phosphopantothenoylcysteine decarboxylase/phosphopantothenate--cysteine ligase